MNVDDPSADSGRASAPTNAELVEMSVTGAPRSSNQPTLADRRCYVARRFALSLDGRSLLAGTVEDVDRWHDTLAVSPVRQVEYLGLLSSFYQWAVEHRLVEANPVEQLRQLLAADRMQHRQLARSASTADYLVEWAKHLGRRGLTPGTIDRNVHQIRVLNRWLAPYDALHASHHDIERFLGERRGRRGRSLDRGTQCAWIGGFASFYRWAVAEELAASDPTLRVIRPKLPKHLPRPIGDDDLATALGEARGSRPTMHLMLLLGAYEGMRCAEIATCSSEWIIGDLLRVRGKGDKDRIVPLHPAVRAAIDDLGPAHGLVLPQPERGQWSPRRVSNEIGRFFGEFGIDAKAHQLRHWFGTKTYAATRDLRLVQELMGHASISTTAGYTAFAPGPDSVTAVRGLGVGA